MKHYKIKFQPDGTDISIHGGATILEAAGQIGIILENVCGGKGICGKCKVVLQPSGDEVLACQYRIESDLVVEIPAESRFLRQKILASGINGEIEIDAVKSGVQMFGVAVDLGTTTVVAKLVDMKSGDCKATAGMVNPQSQYGDDVISRICYGETEEKVGHLQKLAIGCINGLIAELCEKAGIEAKSIEKLCVVGNTTMNHIFLGFPIRQLGQAPYEAYSVDAHDRVAGEMGIEINPKGNVHTVENIAGFVGSDTAAVALAVDIGSAKEETLVIDIGTNGELVLAAGGKLYAASCAAGPALEGARISCGSRATDGAIEAVVINKNDIDVDVIGNIAAHSICGSGLIDAAAVLLDLGVIDATGRFVEREKLEGKLPARILGRIIVKDKQPAFCLWDNEDGKSRKVILTQKDIRELQLAKAAIRAGIKLLQKKVGLADEDIKHIFLAGAFGNYIRKESALRIGLLPEVPAERIRFVGNAACSGAQMVLLSSKAREKAKELTRRIEYVEIAREAGFAAVYADSMLF